MYIGPFGSRVALIQFSSRKLTKVEFNLDTYNNTEDMKNAIDDMVYQRKYTYTGYAMNLANKEVRKILRWLPTLSKTEDCRFVPEILNNYFLVDKEYHIVI